jgi:hypothetical protein
MKCYNHNSVDALGTCKACSKGICNECLTDVGNGIACTSTCIDEVKEVNALVEKNKTAHQRASKINIKRGYFYAGIGLVFLIINLQMGTDEEFILLIGLMIFLLGVYSIYVGYKQKNK